VTVDDFIWQLDFVNSIKPSRLLALWQYYYGCIRYSDYSFGIKVNATGLWNFYAYTGGLFAPKKIYNRYWGDKVAAEAFKPAETAYVGYVLPNETGSRPTPMCLYGTGAWIFQYYDKVLTIGRVDKDTHYWLKNAALNSHIVPSLEAPTEANRKFNGAGADNLEKVTKTVVGLDMFNLDTKTNLTCAWTFKLDGVVNGSGSKVVNALGYSHWWQALDWAHTTNGNHTLRIEVTTTYGTSSFEFKVSVLFGDIDNNNIINMLDLYNTALKFGWTGLPCQINHDIDSNGIVNMLDLYIVATQFGKTV
jgi:hypothetical protein